MAPSWSAFAAPLLGVLVAKMLAAMINGDKHVRDFCNEWQHDTMSCDLALDAHLENHTMVHVGGQHRGGTTLLASAFATHPLIATHGMYDAAASDDAPQHLHGEGLFLQSVYPKLSLDHPPLFFLKKRALWVGDTLLRLLGVSETWREDHCRLLEGVGSYALSSHAREMARPGHPLAARAPPARRLFSQWAARWDLSRPILLEKSPSNALAAAMLSGMWAAAGSRGARFVFITRHPIVQSLAMQPFVDDLTLRGRVQHWLAVEEGIREGARRGLEERSVAMLSLEALASQPRHVMDALLAWLNLEPRCHYGRYGCAAAGGGNHWAGLRVLDIDDSAWSLSHPGPARFCSAATKEYIATHRVRDDDGTYRVRDDDGTYRDGTWAERPQAAAWLRTVRGDPNQKYADRYVSELADSELARERHEALVAEFGQRVYDVSGYRLALDPLPGSSIVGSFIYRQEPSREPEWWGRWCATA